MIIVQYLLDARKPVTIPAVGVPKNDFANPVEPVRLALSQEERVTETIEGLAQQAR
jgi:ferritin